MAKKPFIWESPSTVRLRRCGFMRVLLLLYASWCLSVQHSATSIVEVEEQFGSQIVVEANTFDATKGDRAAQGHDCIHRCLKHGNFVDFGLRR